MRERYLYTFDAIRIDCLNGDKYKTGKVAPDGSPDPSIFSIEGDPVGIQVGTAIATLVRKAEHIPATTIGFRHLWGQAKREELLKTAEADAGALYYGIEPVLPLGLPFVQTTVSKDWFDWPALTDLFPVNFSGVNTNRDAFVIDVDRDRLKSRIVDYFNAELDDNAIRKRYPTAMGARARFDPQEVRHALLVRGGPDETGFIPYTYRPFDNRWLYWEAETKLLNEKRPEYRPHVFEGNIWLSAAPHLRKGETEPQACVTEYMASLHLIERGANMFPAWLRDDDIGNAGETNRRPNLSLSAQRYLGRLGAEVEDLFHYVLATLHDPAYLAANSGALQMDWPRIPLPDWPNGETDGVAETFVRTAMRGRELAALLDSEKPVPGVTEAPLRPEIASLAIPATVGGGNMAGDDFAVTAGWGHLGTGDAGDAWAGSRRRAPLRPRGTLGTRGCSFRRWRYDLRHLPQRRGFLEQRSRYRLEL